MNSHPVTFNFAARAREAVIEKGFVPDFPPEVLSEIASQTSADLMDGDAVDLTHLLWSSIDNIDSKDLDQVEYAERLPSGCIRVRVGIADVDARVPQNSATDQFARQNATSVYAGAMTFPMLPNELSSDLSSLKAGANRLALITEFVVDADGEVDSSKVYRARLKNAAKLNYEEVGNWIDGKAELPEKIKSVPGLAEQLQLQKTAADRLMRFRQRNGALTFAGVETVPVIRDNQVKMFTPVEPNAARKMIECFMVATNVEVAEFLRCKRVPCIRRVVRTPKRWDRIREVADSLGTTLPEEPNSPALSEFLRQRKDIDPAGFPDLSLTIVKLLGPGEYIVQTAGEESEGHFGLAVNDYTHSTAPNRRYADLVVQRLVKSALTRESSCYTEEELSEIAARCNDRDNAARHVERLMRKVAAAALLANKIGEVFDGMVTGATPKGTYVRLYKFPAEGRVVRGERGLDVGNKVRVRLVSVQIHEGFIDFEALG